MEAKTLSPYFFRLPLQINGKNDYLCILFTSLQFTNRIWKQSSYPQRKRKHLYTNTLKQQLIQMKYYCNNTPLPLQTK